MITQVLQGNARWQLGLRELTDSRINRVRPYGIVYATHAPVHEGVISLEEIKNEAFWSGIVLESNTGTSPQVIGGYSLSFLLGAANETGATAGQIIRDDMFALDGSRDLTEEERTQITGDAVAPTITDPATAVQNIWNSASLPDDFPITLGPQNWEAETTLEAEIPNWYTLMQGLNAITGVATPSGGWHLQPDGTLIVGTGNRIFRTPPGTILISSDAEILSSAWHASYQAEALNVKIDASRVIGRALVVGDDTVAGVNITDDAWALGGVESSIARARAGVVVPGGAVPLEVAKLLSKRILQTRSRMQTIVSMQFPARSKIITAIKPGDVVGIVETKANWPTQPYPEAWIAYIAGYAIHPFPAVVTHMTIPFSHGMGVYYNFPENDDVLDLTNFVRWESGERNQNTKVQITAGDTISTIYETLLNSASFVEHPTAVPDGSDWEWR